MQQLNLEEKFIDRNIAELCEEYDKIHGANVNLARITPDLVDGLKPVQRRALYIMFLKDQGKTFRKLASISGDTFGRVHPHTPVSIDEALVNLAQEWNNTIPLIEGSGNWGCHDDITEVLTRNGWKLFIDVTKYDLLATVDPTTGNLYFEHPTSLFDYVYDGDMVFGSHHSLDFAVTPNHKMLVKKKLGNSNGFEDTFKFIEAGELPGYTTLMTEVNQVKGEAPPVILEEYRSPNGDYLPRIEISMETWIQFIGIYLADGCMTLENPDKCPSTRIIISANTRMRKASYYDKILLQMGINTQWSRASGGFTFINKRVSDKLAEYGLFGKRSYDKFIPDFVFDLDARYIKLFLYAFAMGYGNLEKWGAVSYRTSSPMIADGIQTLLFMSGKMSKLHVHEPRKSEIRGRTIKSQRPQFHVCEWISNVQSIDKSRDVSTLHYSGHVYCAEVPTYHTLVTRRNGIIMVSGNSVAGDEAGASRYIKARLSEYARACFFDDWKDSVVDMDMAYDEETMEPRYLPAKYPNVLLNGCLGIGYGMAANIPAYNFKDVVDATIMLIANPDANVVLIPDSPTGADIIETDFARLCDTGNGKYSMRCTYEIDDKENDITITSLPYKVTVNTIRERIADIKEKGGLPELIGMSDLSGINVNLQLHIRDDVNPYKFMRKLIGSVAGLENSYSVNITITTEYESFDWSIKKLLIEWIKWRREQKRIVVTHKRTRLLAEQRTNDVKIFLLSEKNLDTIKDIYRNGRNRAEIEKSLIEKYKNSEIRMDSLQARTLSNLRMLDLSIEAYEDCLKRREELENELRDVEDTLKTENGIDKLIVAELRDGIKRFGVKRRSNVVPRKISVKTAVQGACILQLSSDGNILRKSTTNVYEEPVPVDNNGFAVRVDNDAAFILIDENGYHTFVKVNDIPLDVEVPVNRYAKTKISGNIIAMLPCEIDSERSCTLISRQGMLKRIRIADLAPSKKPLIALSKGDKLVRGIVTLVKTQKDLLIYTKEGMGQRLDPNVIRITSPMAKGGNGFRLSGEDEIVGCYAISPEENQYLLYVTAKGKMRLNLIDYLPTRDSKHDAMVSLISLNDRDRLVSIVGCNKLDKVKVFYDNATTEVIDLSTMEESTMGSEPKKMTKSQNAVTTNILKVKVE